MPQGAVREYRSRYEEAVASHARDVTALQAAENRLEETQAAVNRLQVGRCMRQGDNRP